MRVITDIDNFKGTGTVVTIGIFDGVHRGHISILNRLKELSSRYACESVVVTLWPHPRLVLQPEIKKINLLNTLEEKIELIDRHNIDNLIILPFTRELSEITFDKFLTGFLMEKTGLRHLVMGFNHHFGKGRGGSFVRLQELSRIHGFQVEKLEPVILDGSRVSSSGIRSMLEEGRLQAANAALGYSYFINGTVVRGNELGRSIGFPTANVSPDERHKLIPLNGVYSAGVIIDGVHYPGMLNIGFRPTVPGRKNEPVIEVHIFNFDGNLYGRRIKVHFYEWMRREIKFPSVDALKEQLKTDKNEVLRFFGSFNFKVNLLPD